MTLQSKRFHLLKLILLSLPLISSVWAQDQDEDQKVEKISVTGSFIKKIDVQGVSPLESINNEEFTKRGAIEIGDVFRETPAFEAVYSDGGNIRFRGQNAGNVLILLNGLRLPKYNGGYYTSIRDLPTAVVDRVEMLKDSGSATYGSDAMSGVLNFITKDNYEGSQVSAGVSRAEMGSEGLQQTYSASYGKNFSRGNIMGVVQFEKTNAIHEQTLGSYDLQGNPVERRSFVDVNGTDVVGATTGCPSTSPCEPSNLLYEQSRPKNNDISALLTGKYEFDDFTLKLVGLYNRNKTTELNRPQYDGFTVQLSNMNASSSYYSLADTYDNSGRLVVKGKFVEELGDYMTEKTRDSYSLQVGAEGYLGNEWTWNVQTGLSLVNTKDTVISGEANKDALAQLFLDGNFNIFADSGNKSNVSSAKFQPEYLSESTLLQTRAVFAGDIFDLGTLYSGGGYVSMATGAEFVRENYRRDNDESLTNNTAFAQSSSNLKTDRDVSSAFIELNTAVTSKLEANLATRFDHYSDMGNTFNPKLGLSYRPYDFIMFRSTVGTGFRAPGITDVVVNEYTTTTSCPTGVTCAGSNYDQISYNLTDLGPEKSLAYNFGTIIQPLKGLSLVIDQWNYESKDTITAISTNDYIQAEQNIGAAGIQALGATITRNSSGEITSIRTPSVTNIGEQTIRGVDTQVEYQTALVSDFDISLGTSWMFIFDRKRQRFSYEPETKYDSSWKNRSFVAVSNQTHLARLVMVMTSDDIVNQQRSNEYTVKPYEEFDFTYAYSWSWGGKLSFTVKNLFNSKPQAGDNGFNLFLNGYLSESSSTYSPLRRRYFVGYTQTF